MEIRTIHADVAQWHLSLDVCLFSVAYLGVLPTATAAAAVDEDNDNEMNVVINMSSIDAHQPT